MHYRREIDGLRAVAVMPVVLFHAGFDFFGGGFVGVDVFFVISGFLITRILISDLETGNFSILRFYERRARRILPALFVVMAACLPVAWVVMLPNRFLDFAQSLVAVVFFGSNILFWREFGYFAPEAEVKPLLHTWSLAVEEQYYLLFPPILLLLWGIGRARVFWVVVGLAVISLLIAEWGWRNAPSANFFLAPTRAWELLAGSICAFLSVGRPQRSSDVWSGIGLAMIVGAILGFTESTPFPSVYALVPVGGAALVLLFAGPQTLVARGLSWAPLVWIGLISYSLYLWHQPLFAFARLMGLDDGSRLLMGGLSVLAIGLGWATWRHVEQPFRRREQMWLPRQVQVFAVGAAVGAVFVTIGLVGHVTKGFPSRLTAEERAILQYAVYPRQGFYREERCMLTVDQTFADFQPECWEGARSFIIGDSHAAALVAGLNTTQTIGQLTAASCPPALDFSVLNLPDCVEINRFRLDALAEFEAERVYVHADWLQYWERPDFQERFDATLARIAALGTEIVLIGSMPKFHPNLPELMLLTDTPLRPDATIRSEVANLVAINEEVRQIGLRHGAIFWDPLAALCVEATCLAVVPRVAADFSASNREAALLSWDHAHLTYSGAIVVAKMMLDDLDP